MSKGSICGSGGSGLIIMDVADFQMEIRVGKHVNRFGITSSNILCL